MNIYLHFQIIIKENRRNLICHHPLYFLCLNDHCLSFCFWISYLNQILVWFIHYRYWHSWVPLCHYYWFLDFYYEYLNFCYVRTCFLEYCVYLVLSHHLMLILISLLCQFFSFSIFLLNDWCVFFLFFVIFFFSFLMNLHLMHYEIFFY